MGFSILFSPVTRFCTASICSCHFSNIRLFRANHNLYTPKSAASFSMLFTVGASSFMHFWYLPVCFCTFSASCRDFFISGIFSCNFTFFTFSSATSFACSSFSRFKTDKYFSCAPFCSYSIPYSNIPFPFSSLNPFLREKKYKLLRKWLIMEFTMDKTLDRKLKIYREEKEKEEVSAL